MPETTEAKLAEIRETASMLKRYALTTGHAMETILKLLPVEVGSMTDEQFRSSIRLVEDLYRKAVVKQSGTHDRVREDLSLLFDGV